MRPRVGPKYRSSRGQTKRQGHTNSLQLRDLGSVATCPIGATGEVAKIVCVALRYCVCTRIDADEPIRINPQIALVTFEHSMSE